MSKTVEKANLCDPKNSSNFRYHSENFSLTVFTTAEMKHFSLIQQFTVQSKMSQSIPFIEVIQQHPEISRTVIVKNRDHILPRYRMVCLDSLILSNLCHD